MYLPIVNISESEYQEVVEVWEVSVRATHHFLKEEDIVHFKPLILNEYLKAVDLCGVKNAQQEIIGFLGVAEGKIEMLFIILMQEEVELENCWLNMPFSI